MYRNVISGRCILDHVCLMWTVMLFGMFGIFNVIAGGGEKFSVEGRALVSGVRTQEWTPFAHALLDGEEHVGFFRLDGSFTLNDVPAGSYVVHIVSPVYKFEPVRVDITATGKMRSRRVNYIKTSEVVQLPYPVQMSCTGQHSYFTKRDTWSWSDFFMNPMFLMMVFPILIILLLPKLINMNDPGMRREMEQSMNMLNTSPEIPDMSELMTTFFAAPKRQEKLATERGQRGSGPRRR